MQPFHPAVRDWFTSVFRTPTQGAGDGLAGHRPRRLDADLRPDRQRQDADRVPLGARPADVRAASAEGAPLPRRLHLAAESAGGRRRAQPPRAARPESPTSPRSAARSSCMPSIAIRTGDTPPAERARFLRDPADILITTPESIYLMLTSNAREMLRGVETIIVDEVHALVPNKRGAHLALSLERLARSGGQAAAADRVVGDAEAAGGGGEVPGGGAGCAVRVPAERARPASTRHPTPARHHHQHRREKAALPPRRSARRGDGQAQRVLARRDAERAGGAGRRARRSGRPFIRGCWS